MSREYEARLLVGCYLHELWEQVSAVDREQRGYEDSHDLYMEEYSDYVKDEDDFIGIEVSGFSSGVSLDKDINEWLEEFKYTFESETQCRDVQVKVGLFIY